ncbi:MAG: hypothetical protein MHPSP_000726 [Paramarteilia canceri]
MVESWISRFLDKPGQSSSASIAERKTTISEINAPNQVLGEVTNAVVSSKIPNDEMARMKVSGQYTINEVGINKAVVKENINYSAQKM